MVKLLSIREHFLELKSRITFLLVIYVLFFIFCYYCKKNIYNIILAPLIVADHELHKIIYTGLAEAFFTYIKLAAFASFMLLLPFISAQLYLFIKDALSKTAKKIAIILLTMAPLLFWSGAFFVFNYVMPKAWKFFIGFEDQESIIPIMLEARISEYLNIVIQLIIAFGIAFQLPIVLILLNLLKILNYKTLVKKRRLAIVINFIIGGILTPPDIISQFALAIPLVLLYEISIVACKFIETRSNDA